MFSLILVTVLVVIIVNLLWSVISMTNSIYVILGFVLGCAATLAIALIGLGLV